MFMPVGSARTMDFNANDVGFVPANAGHYVENTGDTDLVFLELFKASEYADFSLNQWIRRVPPEMVYSHLKLDKIRFPNHSCRKAGHPAAIALRWQTQAGRCRSPSVERATCKFRRLAMFCDFQLLREKYICSKSCSPLICW